MIRFPQHMWLRGGERRQCREGTATQASRFMGQGASAATTSALSARSVALPWGVQTGHLPHDEVITAECTGRLHHGLLNATLPGALHRCTYFATTALEPQTQSVG